MSVIADLNIRVGLDPSGISKGLRQAEAQLRRISQKFQEMGSDMSRSVSLPLAGIGIAALKSAGDLESLKLGFNTTMKAAGRSASEAVKELAALQEVAKMPGIDFEQAIKGSQRLQGVGMSAEKARVVIAELANGIAMAGGTAENLSGVTNQLAQMAGKGKVMQSDLNIMLENLPMLAKVMKDTFGATTADGLRDLGVNADKFIDGITKGLSKLERVPGGLQNSFVNAGVAIKMSLATIGESINKAFNITGKLDAFSDWIMRAANAFAGLNESTKTAILSAAAFIAAIGPTIKIVTTIWMSVQKLRVAYIALGAASQIYSKELLSNLTNMASGQSALSAFGARLDALKKAWAALSLAVKATAIGVVIAVVAAAAIAFSQWSNSMTEAARTQKMLNDVQLEAAKSIISQSNETKKLTDIVADGNAKYEDRKAALDKLNQISPEYFGGLSLEKSTVDDINKSYVSYVDNLKKVSLAKAASGKLKELQEQQLDLKLEVQKFVRSTSSAERAMIAMRNSFSMGNALGDMDFIAGANRKLADLGEQIKLIGDYSGKLNQSLNNTPTPTGGGNGDGDGGKGKTEKTVASTLAELTKAYDMAALKGEALGASFDVQGERASALQSAIVTLLGMGIKPSDEALAPLIERYANLNMEMGLLPQKFDGITSSAQPLLETTTQLTNMAATVSVAWQALGETMTSSLQAAGQAMIDYANAGGTSLKKMGQEALKAAAQVARGALISFVSSVIKDTGIAAGPLGAIVGPAAGAAAGLAFNSILKALKVPAFESGGRVDSPTLAMFGEYPGAKSNPEYALRQDQLQGLLNKAAGQGGGGSVTITGYRINGTDLYLMMEQAGQKVNRSRGF